MDKSAFHKLTVFLLAVTAAASGILGTGCNEKPTQISETLIPDTIVLGAVNSKETSIITDYEQETHRLPLFNLATLFIGKHNEYEALTFLRFPNLPDTLDFLREEHLQYVRFRIYPDFYAFGDTIENNLAFNIYKIQKLFTNETTWDSIQQSSEPFWGNDILGTFSGNIAPHGDTLDPLEIELEKSIIADWALSLGDSLAETQNYGIALIPQDESTYIRKFFSQGVGAETPRPEIEMVYTGLDNESHTLTLKSANDFSAVNGKEPDEGMMTSQGAVSYKSRLYFDVSMLPPFAAVHNSELVLTLNEELSRWGNGGEASLIEADLLADTSLTSDLLRYYEGKRQEGGNKYVFNTISYAVEVWNRKDGEGFLVIVPAGAENLYRKMDRMVFYPPDYPDSTKRPYLKIVYSKRPDFGKDSNIQE